MDNRLENENDQIELQSKLRKLYETRDSMLSQKAKMCWMKLEDGNTRFYHQAIQKRKSRNNIKKLLWENNWLTSLVDIKQTFFRHYSGFFRDQGNSIIELGSLPLTQITEQGKNSLIREVSRQEVEAALNSMASDKSPGPDGLNARSIKFLWPLIRVKIEAFIRKFLESGTLRAGVNSSFISLIPKMQEPKSVKDFRPISLINTTFKILTKLLAVRLSNHMPSLISDNQSGFIKGR